MNMTYVKIKKKFTEPIFQAAISSGLLKYILRKHYRGHIISFTAYAIAYTLNAYCSNIQLDTSSKHYV